MKRQAWLVLSIIVVVLGVIGLLSRSAIEQAVQNLVFDSVPTTIPCTQWPNYTTAAASFRMHATLVNQIRQAGGTLTIVPGSCPGDHAEVLIQYGSHDQRSQIEQLLKNETLGVPVSLQNI